MKTLKLMAAILGMMLTTQINGQTVLIDNGSSWSYYDNADEPSDIGSNDWNDTNYNSTSWSQGNAQLGYGDSDESTAINSNTKTAYFRHNFNVEDINQYKEMQLELIFDDGAVVYLNGVEIWRVNMPLGNITYDVFATRPSEENESSSIKLLSPFVVGDNVFAIEIHQANDTSSDLSFDFKATATPPNFR